jgi:hypothetical protein
MWREFKSKNGDPSQLGKEISGSALEIVSEGFACDATGKGLSSRLRTHYALPDKEVFGDDADEGAHSIQLETGEDGI